jgi:hypothetical protein
MIVLSAGVARPGAGGDFEWLNYIKASVLWNAVIFSRTVNQMNRE